MEHITRNIIDLHCDTLTECYKRGIGFKSSELHFSLDKLPESFRLCQAMAVFMPDELRGQDAVAYFDNVCAVFFEQMLVHNKDIAQIHDTTTVGGVLREKRFAAILTVEGGSALAGELSNLKRMYDMGVRMMTLTWNAENEICGGCATDLGFTDFGRQVVCEMERLGMAVDVSHLSDRGFWELCGFATKPFAASHSNSRAICGHRRNLTDDMFKEIVSRNGIVGLNYARCFIREDSESGTVDDLLRHVYHFLELGGEGTLALGSDFDGTDVPDYIGSLEGVGFLAESLERSGISRGVTDKILYYNASRFFGRL